MNDITEQLIKKANKYFKNEVQAMSWLSTPKALLDNNRPLDVPKEALVLINNMINGKVFK